MDEKLKEVFDSLIDEVTMNILETKRNFKE